jgi:kynurenine formamidase
MRHAVILLLLATGCASARGVEEKRMVDLSHPFDANTIYWPTATKFELKRVAWGPSPAGYWYASDDFRASEHGGTHIDAPIHFAEGKNTVDQIPLAQLMGPARVVDVRERCRLERDYRVSPDDIAHDEDLHGTIAPGSIVFFRTGYGEDFYPDAKQYLGSDVRGDASHLHFPGIGEQAARLLVLRQVDAVGLDTASLDCGPSTDFIAHRVLMEANIPGLENVANLDRVPPTGAWVIALPMKIGGGTGGPCRIVAFLP